jgi:hypothetical protein
VRRRSRNIGWQQVRASVRERGGVVHRGRAKCSRFDATLMKADADEKKWAPGQPADCLAEDGAGIACGARVRGGPYSSRHDGKGGGANAFSLHEFFAELRPTRSHKELHCTK